MVVRRLGILVLCLLACGGGVGVASVITDGGGAPAAADDPQRFAARPGTAADGAQAADPQGGPDWALRTYTSQAGLQCVDLGRVDGARFGTPNAEGDVEPRPAGEGLCGPPGQIQAAVQRFARSGRQPSRTVIFGQASAMIERAVISRAGRGEQRAAVSANSFIAVLAGKVEPAELDVGVDAANGTSQRFAWP